MGVEAWLKHWSSLSCGVFQLRPPNKAGLRSLIEVKPAAVALPAKRPRYVEARKLASGITAYYWCRPWWARTENCSSRNEALGLDLDQAIRRAAVLNEMLDAWRTARRTRGSKNPDD